MYIEFLIFAVFGLSAALLVFAAEIRSEFFKDFTLWLSVEGRDEIHEENYLKHFFRSGYLAVMVVFLCYWIAPLQFAGFHWYEATSLFLIGGFAGNVLREAVKQIRGGRYASGAWKIPFSWRDCRYGGYGFAVFGVASIEILKLILTF